MNRVYLLMFALLVLSMSAFAQRSVNLQMLPSQIAKNTLSASTLHVVANNEKILYDGDGTTKYYFIYNVKNLGPDSLTSGDSVIIDAAWGYYAALYFGPTDSLDKDSSMFVFPADQSGNPAAVSLMPNPQAITTSQTITNVRWCDSVYAKRGTALIADPTYANNVFCATAVELTFWLTGINTVTNMADGFLVYPNPANGKLNVKFEMGSKAENVSVVLRDVVGKVVYNHNFGTASGTIEHAINVAHLTPGMYMAELNYNGEKIVSKVSIQ